MKQVYSSSTNWYLFLEKKIKPVSWYGAGVAISGDIRKQKYNNLANAMDKHNTLHLVQHKYTEADLKSLKCILKKCISMSI